MARKQPMRISLKLYFDLLERIYSSFDSVTAECLAELVRAYAYFRDVIALLENCPESVRMIFKFMLPELDRGARRSARAREMAERRKQLQAASARLNESPQNQSVADNEPETQAEPEPPVQRTERKLYSRASFRNNSPPHCRGSGAVILKRG